MKVVTFEHSRWRFVFGANKAGRHGKGAALTAKRHYGAKEGQGEGYAGRSYAIPTKDADLQVRSLDDISRSVANFVRFAHQRQDMEFQVTRLGCGLAGYADADIAPMFEGCPPNVLLPRKWYIQLGKIRPEFRLIVAGTRTFDDYEFVKAKLDALLAQVDVPIRIVSGTQEGIDTLGERYASENELTLARFEPNWNLLGNAAGPLRNEAMAWYSDALALFWRGDSKGSKSMLNIAHREELPLRDIRVA